MKKLALSLCLLFVAGVAFAQQAQEKEAEKTTEKAAAVKTHDAEVVSADVKAKTITIKGEKENKTLPVVEKALASLKDIKGGEKVTLTLEKDEEAGSKQVVAIKVKKPEAPEEK